MKERKESPAISIVYGIAAVIALCIAVLSFIKGQTAGGAFSLILALAMGCMCFVHFAILRAQKHRQEEENKKTEE